MGQYYKPVLLRDDKVIIAFATSWEYSNGAKLMEHSWLTNGLVAVIENLLLNTPTRIVWAGDYGEKDLSLGINEDEVAEGYDGKMNLYELCGYRGNALKEVRGGNTKIGKSARYVVNHTTKEFINKTKVPISHTYTNENGKEWLYQIHPLPLMTCDNNGAGGSFYGKDPNKLVGSWSGNEISIETRKPRGYKEVIFDLVE